jgi:arylsulfatase A-like enzyme
MVKLQKRIKLLIPALLILAGLAFKSCSTMEKLPNIVIILVDDMGYGDPGCYNPDSKIPTPHIDQLAAEGMRFMDAHAAGTLCHPSRYGLMTGRYPFRTDVSVWREKPTIEEDRVTIASMLKSQGYHTAMVGKWHLGFLENGYENPLPGGPVDRGFDSYFGIRASTDIPPYFYIRDNMAVEPPTDRIEANSSEGWSPIQGAFWRAGGIAPGMELKDVLPRFTSEAIEVIENHSGNKEYKNKPLMIYLAYPAPHTPWLPSPEFKGKSGAGMYGDFMMMVDDQIGKVLDALERTGLYENTLLVFSSDNGPVWYDADVERLGHDSSGGLRGMKADAWEGGHRMPFIVRWPGKVEMGSFTDRTICFTDVLATLAEATGAELPEGASPDSYSFLPVLLGEETGGHEARPPLVLSSGNGTMMIRSGDWKLINQLGSGGFSKPGRIEPGPGDPEGQLYNLAEDPGETNNRYLEHPDIVARLKSEMKQIVEK